MTSNSMLRNQEKRRGWKGGREIERGRGRGRGGAFPGQLILVFAHCYFLSLLLQLRGCCYLNFPRCCKNFSWFLIQIFSKVINF